MTKKHLFKALCLRWEKIRFNIIRSMIKLKMSTLLQIMTLILENNGLKLYL